MGANCCQSCENVQVQNVPCVNNKDDITNNRNGQMINSYQLYLNSPVYFSPKYIGNYKENLGQKPLKHKVYNRWYWGLWRDGCPYGIGILYNKQDNKSLYYEGQFEGQPQGFGKVVYNCGQWEYTGHISKGKANGKGQIFNKKQGFKFQGEWKQSKPYIGTLTLYNVQGSQAQNPKNQPQNKIFGNITIFLDNSKPGNTAQINYPDGKIYKGEINPYKYLPEGHGQLTFPNNNRYVGDWAQGQMSGQGKFYWSDGSYYEGEYLEGKKHGIGKFIYTSGNYYVGYWKNGKQEGHGILYDPDKNQLKNGPWKNGTYQNKH